jgi:hypothetical protein
MTTTEVETIEEGDVVAGGPDRVPCEVLRIEPGTETVWPLAGRPCIRLWVRREDTGEEGSMTFGPGGLVEVLTSPPDPAPPSMI